MNPEYLNRMSEAELDEYAKALGFTAKAAPDKSAKIDMITRRREKVVTVSALGIDFDIPVKRAHDKRVADLLTKPTRSDEEAEKAMQLLLGEEQFTELANACIEDDGTVDVEAMGYAYVRILTSDELKNF